MITRGHFLRSLSVAGLAMGTGSQRVLASTIAPRRVAIITSVWTYLSHVQHIGDRFLVGYPRHGSWHQPPLKLVSL